MTRDGGNGRRIASIVLTTGAWTSRATESSPTCDCPLHHFRVGDKKLCFKDTPSFITATQVSISLKHTVNVVNVTARTAPTEDRFLGRVRKVVTFFHCSTTSAHALASKQEMPPWLVDKPLCHNSLKHHTWHAGVLCGTSGCHRFCPDGQGRQEECQGLFLSSKLWHYKKKLCYYNGKKYSFISNVCTVNSLTGV